MGLDGVLLGLEVLEVVGCVGGGLLHDVEQPLEVGVQGLALLLVLRLAEALADLLHVLALLEQHLLGLVQRVVQVDVALVLLELQVDEVVDLAEAPLVLAQLDRGGRVLDLALEHAHLLVLVRHASALLHELLVLARVVLVDRAQHLLVLLRLDALLPPLRLLQLLLQPLLLRAEAPLHLRLLLLQLLLALHQRPQRRVRRRRARRHFALDAALRLLQRRALLPDFRVLGLREGERVLHRRQPLLRGPPRLRLPRQLLLERLLLLAQALLLLRDHVARVRVLQRLLPRREVRDLLLDLLHLLHQRRRDLRPPHHHAPPPRLHALHRLQPVRAATPTPTLAFSLPRCSCSCPCSCAALRLATLGRHLALRRQLLQVGLEQPVSDHDLLGLLLPLLRLASAAWPQAHAAGCVLLQERVVRHPPGLPARHAYLHGRGVSDRAPSSGLFGERFKEPCACAGLVAHQLEVEVEAAAACSCSGGLVALAQGVGLGSEEEVVASCSCALLSGEDAALLDFALAAVGDGLADEGGDVVVLAEHGGHALGRGDGQLGGVLHLEPALGGEAGEREHAGGGGLGGRDGRAHLAGVVVEGLAARELGAVVAALVELAHEPLDDGEEVLVVEALDLVRAQPERTPRLVEPPDRLLAEADLLLEREVVLELHVHVHVAPRQRPADAPQHLVERRDAPDARPEVPPRQQVVVDLLQHPRLLRHVVLLRLSPLAPPPLPLSLPLLLLLLESFELHYLL